MTSTSANPDLWVIYGLRAVDDPEYRYVGYTTIGAAKRLIKHKKDTVYRDFHVQRWILSIGSDRVVIDTLEICPEGDLRYIAAAERKWISRLKSEGHRLTNLNDGGIGGNAGRTHSDKSKKKISESLGANPNTRGEGHWNFGRHLSDEHKEKMSVSLKGKTHSEETKAKFRENASNRDDSFRLEKTREANHIRWHVNRSIIKTECLYCVE
jgi:group I intron endonuclease